MSLWLTIGGLGVGVCLWLGFVVWDVTNKLKQNNKKITLASISSGPEKVT